MEVSKEIIEKAFILVQNGPSSAKLDVLLRTLSDYPTNDILNLSSEVRKIDSNIYSTCTNAIYRGSHAGNDATANVATIVKSANKYLSQAISDGDLKSLLIFLSVNCYLKANPGLFFQNLGLSVESKVQLSKNIIGLLKNLKLQTVVPANAPYYEKELKSTSEEGFKRDDIDKVYQLILALERGGRGFHFNFLLENLIRFLFIFDKEKFYYQLSSLTHPEEMVFYLQGFSKDDLIEIANEGKQRNKWLLHELIRQIVEKEKKEEYPHDSDKRCLASCLREMHLVDPVFYLKSANFFQRSKLFNAALGSQLVDLDSDKIADVITSALPIDRYTFNLEARTLLLEEFGQSASPERIASIARVAYDN